MAPYQLFMSELRSIAVQTLLTSWKPELHEEYWHFPALQAPFPFVKVHLLPTAPQLFD